MGKCVKGKEEDKPRTGRYRCEKCGGVSAKKDHICKPRKIREGEAEKGKK